MSQKVRIVFRGEIIAEKAEALQQRAAQLHVDESALEFLRLETVKQRAAELLKATPEQIERIFSGEPVVLRKELPEEDGPHYQAALEGIGMRVYIEKMEAAEAAPQQPPQKSRLKSYLAAEVSPFPKIVEPDEPSQELALAEEEVAEETEVECPRCRAKQEKSAYCRECGAEMQPPSTVRNEEARPVASPVRTERADHEEAPAYVRGARQGARLNVTGHGTAGLMDYLSFGPSGHMKRLTFWTAGFLLNALAMLIFGIFAIRMLHAVSQDPTLLSSPDIPGSMAMAVILLFILGIVHLIICIRVVIQRCRDIGWTPWLVLLFLVPIVNLILALCLLFWPSGMEEAPRGSWRLFLVGLALELAVSFWYHQNVIKPVRQLQQETQQRIEQMQSGRRQQTQPQTPQQPRQTGGPEDQRRLMELLEKQREGPLSQEEEYELTELLDRQMQQKGR